MIQTKDIIFNTPQQKPQTVTAIWIEDEANKGFYLLPSGSLLTTLKAMKYKPKVSVHLIENGLATVLVEDEGNEVYAYGSCLIGREYGLDPVGIAIRRGYSNFALATGEFQDAFDKIRELNGGTLDLDKSDKLNQSLEAGF